MGLFLFCTFLFIALAIFACSACHSSGTLFFILTHTHTHTHNPERASNKASKSDFANMISSSREECPRHASPKELCGILDGKLKAVFGNLKKKNQPHHAISMCQRTKTIGCARLCVCVCVCVSVCVSWPTWGRTNNRGACRYMTKLVTALELIG